MLLALLGCGGPPPFDPAEWLPGGDGTNTLLLGGDAFRMPTADLDPADEQDFYSGNSFFNQAWVEAPASTAARDGLGPLMNARSCSGCHQDDGRAQPPADGRAPFGGLLLRISTPHGDPDPLLGGQVQDLALPELPPEAEPSIRWEEVEGTFGDGERYTLARPIYTVVVDGVARDDLRVSPRVAPQMIGLGLLEAIPVERAIALSDPDDLDGDGISGRLQELDGEVGRFGWKGDAPDVARQVAGAFAGDLGLTSRLAPADDCTALQPACLALPSGGEPEVSDAILDLVTLYSRALAVPVRRDAEDPEVLEGRDRFFAFGCAACHVPEATTGASPVAALEDERIWPYTDLLLHDLGPGLADDRPLAAADGREWKTPPLWGLGLVDEVSGHTRFLHDGRARDLAEAVSWHDGEARAARDAFVAADAGERRALLRFLEDL